MKLTATILIVIGVLLALYGWWGIVTNWGERVSGGTTRWSPPVSTRPRFFIGLGGLASILAPHAIILIIIAVWRSK